MNRDGWHLTHVCGGLARELLDIDDGVVLCPFCLVSAKLTIRPDPDTEQQPEQHPDERLAEGRFVRQFTTPDPVTAVAKTLAKEGT